MSTGEQPSRQDVSTTIAAEETEARAFVEQAFRAGRCTFLGVELLVDPGALVPRPETELLARAALARIETVAPRPGTPVRVVDMCCGSGNLACVLALKDARTEVLAADLTDGCVSLARRNVAFVGMNERVRVYQGDLFGAFAGLDIEGQIDIIVCNPPYISKARLKMERASLLEKEPLEAFDGGPYGLSIHQRVIKEAATILRPGGTLLFEIGLGQERQIQALFDRAKTHVDVSFVPDDRGRPRVAIATRPV